MTSGRRGRTVPEAVFVAERSAGERTVVVEVEVLSPGSMSPVTAVIEAVFARVEPIGVAADTVPVIVNVAVPTGNEATEQETVAPVVQVQPAAPVKEANVVPAGSGSDHVTLLVALGPAFVRVTVQARVPPGSPARARRRRRSRRRPRRSRSSWRSRSCSPVFGSEVVEVTVAVFERTVPPVTDGPTVATSVKTALPPTGSVGIEQETVAPVVQVQPATGLSETNVVPAGSVSEK